ncbi:LPXTG cell wall anchor domain-containing protein [Enterococcus mundtii]
MRKKNHGFCIIVFIVLFSLLPYGNTYAREVRSIETEGNIGFTGVYEPIGTPDPIPPENIVKSPTNDPQKSDGLLPKTNDTDNLWLKWAGIFIISITILLWNKKKYQIYINEKVGFIK